MAEEDKSAAVTMALPGLARTLVAAGKLDGDCVAAIRKHREAITAITERYVDVDA